MDANEIKGELVIKDNPEKRGIEYINQEKLREDQEKYNSIIEEYSGVEEDDE